MSFDRIEEVSDRHLHIVWTTGDPVTAQHMVLMYARNSMLNHWWDRVTVVIWGASQQLVIESPEIREAMKVAELAGVEFSACASCAVNLRTTQGLEAQCVEVIRWGEKLSLLMQSGKPVLSV